MSLERQAAFCKRLTSMLENEGVAYDVGSYRDAPPGLRVWCGATVEAGDVRALTAWFDWAYAACRAEPGGAT
jgi:phosphoserine aminotransferase